MPEPVAKSAGLLLRSSTGAGDDNFLQARKALAAAVSDPNEGRIRLGNAGWEQSFNGSPYTDFGAWSFFDLADAGTTEAAITAALALSRKRGVVLYDTAGAGRTFNAASITVPAGKTLCSSGWAGDVSLVPQITFTGNRQLIVEGEIDDLRIVSGAGQTVDTCVSSTGGIARNIKVSASPVQTNYAFFNKWKRIDGCEVSGLLGVRAVSTSVTRGYTIINNCRFDQVTPTGANTYGLNIAGSLIIQDVYVANYVNGIYLQNNADEAHLIEVEVRSCSNYGIYAKNADRISIHSAYVQDCTVAGMYIDSCSVVRIAHGRILNGATGFYATTCDRLLFSDYFITGTTSYGARIENTSEATVKGLNFTSNTGRSLDINLVLERLTVSDIVLYQSGGIRISTCTSLAVTNIAVETTVGVGAIGTGLLMTGNYATVLSNATVNDSNGIGMDLQGNNVIFSGSNLSASDCTTDGIVAGGACVNFRLDGVNVNNNGGRGVYLIDVTSPNLAYISNLTGTGNGTNPEVGTHGLRWVVELGVQKMATLVNTTPYTMKHWEELVRVDATGGARVVNLPGASTLRGKQFIVKKTDATANTVTVTATGGDTIDGVVSRVLAAQYASLTLVSNGSTWSLV